MGVPCARGAVKIMSDIRWTEYGDHYRTESTFNGIVDWKLQAMMKDWRYVYGYCMHGAEA